MRTFYLNRSEDETGVSGTGRVAQGIEFDNGRCALTWLTIYTSIAVYENIEMVENIHGHDGRTIIEWDSEVEHIEELECQVSELEEENKIFKDLYYKGGITFKEKDND